MKTIPNAIAIRSFILENFEQAIITKDREEQQALMNIVLVGVGPTGVELAGAFAEMKNDILPKDYPDLDISQMNIILIQNGDKLLNTMREKASVKSEAYLQKMGVQVIKNTRVLSYDGYQVNTNNDYTINAYTVIWTAGVEAASPHGLALSCLDKSKRIVVNAQMQMQAYPHVFALGDVACMQTDETPNGLTMLAQPAIQQGRYLANFFKNLASNKSQKPFVYKDKGAMATVGRNKALADIKNKTFSGFFAWLIWLIVHLLFLIGFKNRAEVLINWIYNYLRHDRESRLIITPYKKRSWTSFSFDLV